MMGWTDGLDRSAVLAFEPAPNVGWPLALARALTLLGSDLVVACWTAAAALGLVVAGDKARALRLAAASGGALLLTPVLKLVFDRPRPDAVPHLVDVSMASFPSGHSLHSAAAYMTLAAVAATSSRHRLAAFLLAAVLTLLIGTSRIYLGVHYPTDVFAGWCLGGAWAVVCAVAFPSDEGKGRDRES
ncbi:MAG: phosphatase PAP2 family protein [Acidobacteria bacterium]|nr:phosphatase PAP2 family protein [Acidobacteriota bacterium]